MTSREPIIFTPEAGDRKGPPNRITTSLAPTIRRRARQGCVTGGRRIQEKKYGYYLSDCDMELSTRNDGQRRLGLSA